MEKKMNADSFRYLYEYHFSENRTLVDLCISSLTREQFTREADYSHGSVCNQVVHLMNVDEVWFSDLRGIKPSATEDLADYSDWNNIRSKWELVEQDMRDYLADLRDDMLFKKPFAEGEDKDLILWQVLLHVVNHGTDHRAQTLRMLHDFGVKTTSQDFVFYVYDHI